jgi:hypothetical protein
MLGAVLKMLSAATTVNCLQKAGIALQADCKSKSEGGSDDMAIAHIKKPPTESKSEP